MDGQDITGLTAQERGSTLGQCGPGKSRKPSLVTEAIAQPCSTGHKAEDTVLMLSTGPAQVQPDSTPQSLVDLVCSWGRAWMWESMPNSGPSFKWAVTVLAEGTGTWVTNGSFMPDTADNVSGAGLLLYCSKTGHKLTGSFYEESKSAGSHRGEQLGLLAIHIVIVAIIEFYGITVSGTTICCDNGGGL